jgi:hypothetical protein
MARRIPGTLTPHVAKSAPGGSRPASVAWPAVLLALICGFLYLLVAGQFDFRFEQTNYQHHLLMADAMLHGQLHIRPQALQQKANLIARRLSAEIDELAGKAGQTVSPQERQQLIQEGIDALLIHDWAVHDNRLYGYWGPLTPLMALPFVGLFGVQFSDLLINVLYGSINVALFYWLLARVDRIGLCPMEPSCRLALTLVLAFGTSHFWMTCVGQIWFAVQIITLTFILLAMIAACSPAHRLRDAAFCGLAFGAALLGRSVVLFLGLFFVVLLAWRCRRPRHSKPAAAGEEKTRSVWTSFDVRALLMRITAFGLPVVAALAAQSLYNYARFGDFRESGLEVQIRTGGNPRYLKDFEQYGFLSTQYLSRNFKYYFWNLRFPREPDGQRWFDAEGNSVFLMTPPLLYIFLAWRRWTALSTAALLGALPLIAVLMLFLGTGWMQFGPRYLLDCTPMLLLVAAAGMGGRLTHVAFILVVAAVGIQIFGTARMLTVAFDPGAGWIITWASPPVILVSVILVILGRLAWMKWLWRAKWGQARGES